MNFPGTVTGDLAAVLPGCLTALGMRGLSDPLGIARDLDGVNRVAVLLVDGMGWAQVAAMAPVAPILSGLPRRRIEAGFPSTTPTSLVSLATGSLPGAHGVLGFTVRIPGTRKVLNHVLWRDSPQPKAWQPVAPLYVAASASGIPVTVVNRPEYVGTGLTKVTSRGAVYQPASGVDEVATRMLAALRDKPGLVYGYHPDLDKAGHMYGLDTAEWYVAASDVERLIYRLVTELPQDAALVVTADHGQLDVPSDHRYDIDTDPGLSAGVEVFAGEPRLRYLHTTPGAVDDVVAAWRAITGPNTTVATRDEVIDSGCFGPFDPKFAGRIGDVVVLCRNDWAVLASQREHVSVSALVAMHGGVEPDEREIPLIVVRGQ